MEVNHRLGMNRIDQDRRTLTAKGQDDGGESVRIWSCAANAKGELARGLSEALNDGGRGSTGNFSRRWRDREKPIPSAQAEAGLQRSRYFRSHKDLATALAYPSAHALFDLDGCGVASESLKRVTPGTHLHFCSPSPCPGLLLANTEASTNDFHADLCQG